MDSIFEATIARYMTKLALVRQIRKSEPYVIPVNLSNKEAAEYNNPPIIDWLTPGGQIVDLGHTQRGITQAALVNRASCDVRLWMNDRGELEQLLQQMVTASKLMELNTLVDFTGVRYTFNSNVAGRWSQRGQVMDLAGVGVIVPAAIDPEGLTVEREVVVTKLQAGMVSNISDPLDQADRGVAEWNG